MTKPNRDASGRFLPGHGLPGPGNPQARRVHQIRSVIREAVSDGDLVRVLRMLLERAEDGDVQAAREVLDRRLGKASQRVEVAHEGAADELRQAVAELAADPVLNAWVRVREDREDREELGRLARAAVAVLAGPETASRRALVALVSAAAPRLPARVGAPDAPEAASEPVEAPDPPEAPAPRGGAPAPSGGKAAEDKAAAEPEPSVAVEAPRRGPPRVSWGPDGMRVHYGS